MSDSMSQWMRPRSTSSNSDGKRIWRGKCLSNPDDLETVFANVPRTQSASGTT